MKSYMREIYVVGWLDKDLIVPDTRLLVSLLKLKMRIIF